jgi:hypothetical protein
MPERHAPHVQSPSSYKPSPILSFCPQEEQVNKIGFDKDDFGFGLK